MKISNIFKNKKEKFVFDGLFKFEDYPEILNYHNKYNQLVNKAYEIESLYDNQKCSKEDYFKSLDYCNHFYENDYARIVYESFYGKNLKIKRWKSKKIYSFDELFSKPFDELTDVDKNNMMSIVELKYGWKLPSEYYNKK